MISTPITSDKNYYVNYDPQAHRYMISCAPGASVSWLACSDQVGRGWRGFGGEVIPALLITGHGNTQRRPFAVEKKIIKSPPSSMPEHPPCKRQDQG